MKKLLLSSVILFVSLPVFSQTEEIPDGYESPEANYYFHFDSTKKDTTLFNKEQFKKNVKTLAKVSGKVAVKTKNTVDTYFIKPFIEGVKEEKQKKH